MASTNFKLFDENKTNMMSDTEYNINTQRLNGVQAGIASSQLQNKTLYQTSLMSYALAQIMNQNGIDANDTAAVSAFVNGLSDTLVQKVLDKATEQMAIAGTDNSHYMTPALVKALSNKLISEADPRGPWKYVGNFTQVLNDTLTTIAEGDQAQKAFASLNQIMVKINNVKVNSADNRQTLRLTVQYTNNEGTGSEYFYVINTGTFKNDPYLSGSIIVYSLIGYSGAYRLYDSGAADIYKPSFIHLTPPSVISSITKLEIGCSNSGVPEFDVDVWYR